MINFSRQFHSNWSLYYFYFPRNALSLALGVRMMYPLTDTIISLKKITMVAAMKTRMIILLKHVILIITTIYVVTITNAIVILND